MAGNFSQCTIMPLILAHYYDDIVYTPDFLEATGAH